LGGIFLEMPSGKHTKTYGKSPFSMEKSTISMVMFNSYVKLPEGKHPQKWGFLNHSGVFMKETIYPANYWGSPIAAKSPSRAVSSLLHVGNHRKYVSTAIGSHHSQ